MGQAIPAQHPAVVLRSHYNHLRALLVIAMIAVVGLTVAVAILANDDDGRTSASFVSPVGAPAQAPPAQRYDGGPNEGTSGLLPAQRPTTRYDGGPNEGTRGLLPGQRPTTRYDGGPEEGSTGFGH